MNHLRTQPIGPERLRCHYLALKILDGRTLGELKKVAFISNYPVDGFRISNWFSGLAPTN